MIIKAHSAYDTMAKTTRRDCHVSSPSICYYQSYAIRRRIQAAAVAAAALL